MQSNLLYGINVHTKLAYYHDRFFCMCKKIGRDRIHAIVQCYRIPFAERSRSPIHLSAVMCNGTESRIIDCPHSNSTQDVDHRFDAYIVCRPRGLRYSCK